MEERRSTTKRRRREQDKFPASSLLPNSGTYVVQLPTNQEMGNPAPLANATPLREAQNVLVLHVRITVRGGKPEGDIVLFYVMLQSGRVVIYPLTLGPAYPEERHHKH